MTIDDKPYQVITTTDISEENSYVPYECDPVIQYYFTDQPYYPYGYYYPYYHQVPHLCPVCKGKGKKKARFYDPVNFLGYKNGDKLVDCKGCYGGGNNIYIKKKRDELKCLRKW